MNNNLLTYFLLVIFTSHFSCAPKFASNVSSDISSKEAREIVWPYRFKNDNDTTEFLEFRGVNLFYYSAGDRTNGWVQTIGFYDFKGDTIILNRMSDKQLYEHSKFDSSYIVHRLIQERREIKENDRSKEDLLLEELLSEEFDKISKEDIEYWNKKYRGIDSPHKGFYEANLDRNIWILKDRDYIWKVSKYKNSVDIFYKETEKVKRKWRFW